MCGIAGVLSRDPDEPVAEELLWAMAEKLSHRGPDDRNVRVLAGMGMAFSRLSLLDRQGGGQPMYSENGSVWSVCNGEIYNWRELRNDLRSRGHRLISECDAEILPHLYEEYGMSFVDKLEGQFAFAIYDRETRGLILGRDHFGVQPLYYCVTANYLVFASEAKAILTHPKVDSVLDPVGLDQVLCFPGVVSPRTMFRGVRSVKPGHIVEVTNGTVRERCFWDFDFTQEDIQSDRDEISYIEEFSYLLEESVRKRLQADVPVGIYLSGGLDSSIVAGIAARASVDQLQSFSITFNGREMCEARYQAQMVSRIHSRHHERTFSNGDVVSALRRAVYHAESPLRETHNSAALTLSGMAREEGVFAVLTGQGADELFAGYAGYRFDAFRRSEELGELSRRERLLREKMWGDPAISYDGNYSAVDDLRHQLFSAQYLERLEHDNAWSSLPVDHRRISTYSPINQRSYLDFKLRLADHLLSDHGDRMSMANGVELRHPFLDLEIAHFAERLPTSLKLNGFDEKRIVKMAAQSLVHPDIVRREKFGWYTASSQELMREKYDLIDHYLSNEFITKCGIFDSGAVEAIRKRYGEPGFTIAQPYDVDILSIILTLGIFVDEFGVDVVS